MSEPLGRIEKPEAQSFQSKRKLLLVAPLRAAEGSPTEFVEKLRRYWEQVEQQVAGLEARLGAVAAIYHESISKAGEDGIIVLEQVNPDSARMVKGRCDAGAVLEAVEDRELFHEAADWERFILVGFISEKVARMVTDFYLQATKKRYEHIAGAIDRTLKPGAVGILFIREGHSVQFPQDIEVFLVAPPVLDEIRRWQRDRAAAEKDGPGDKPEAEG